MTLIDTSNPAYVVPCPTCQQRAAAPCFDERYTGTKHRKTPHPARVEAAARAES